MSNNYIKMHNIIITDYDLTLSHYTIIYVYILILFFLKCSTTYDLLIKLIKIILLPIISVITAIFYLFGGDEFSLRFLNFCLFYNVLKTDLSETVDSIKHMILIGLNKKVLKSMNRYNTTHKYIITGNIGSVIGQIMAPFGFKTYGSVLNINENTNRYSGYTDHICMNEKKLDKIKLILFIVNIKRDLYQQIINEFNDFI